MSSMINWVLLFSVVLWLVLLVLIEYRVSAVIAEFRKVAPGAKSIPSGYFSFGLKLSWLRQIADECPKDLRMKIRQTLLLKKTLNLLGGVIAICYVFALMTHK